MDGALGHFDELDEIVYEARSAANAEERPAGSSALLSASSASGPHAFNSGFDSSPGASARRRSNTTALTPEDALAASALHSSWSTNALGQVSRRPSTAAIQAVRRISSFRGISIDSDLAVPAHKELVYWSFSQLLQKFIEDLNVHLANDIPSALSWLLISFEKHPLIEPYFIYTRILIFWTLRRLQAAIDIAIPKPSNIDTLNSLIKKCLALEPIGDFLPTIMIDVTPWLVEHDGKIVFLEDGTAPDVQPLFVDAWNDIYRRPFTTPSPDEHERLIAMMRDPLSRSDAYSHIIKTTNAHLSRLISAQITINSSDAVIANTHLKAMKLKIDWFLRFMSENMLRAPPSNQILRILFDLVSNVQSVYDPDPFSGMNDAAETLKSAIAVAIEALSENFGPKFSQHAKKHSLFTALMIQKRVEEEQKRLGIEPSVASRPLSRAQSQSSSTDMLRDPVSIGGGYAFCGDDMVAMMEDIWLEIDPVVDRIIIPSVENEHQSKRQHISADEILTSVASGLFHLTRTHIMWYGVDTKLARHGGIKNPSALSALRELAVMFPLCSITKFTISKIARPDDVSVHGPGNSQRDRDPFMSMLNSGDGMSLAHGNSGVKSNTDPDLSPIQQPNPHQQQTTIHQQTSPNQLESDHQQYLALAQQRPDEFYLSVFTDEEVYKFFPLSGDEASQLRQLITGLTGLLPFNDLDFVKDVLSKKLSMTRHDVLKTLLQEPNPWIENSTDLNTIISSLTNEHQPQQIMDVERLFHSCRIEPEVTKEAIIILRRIWYETSSETTKIKVLSIVDRLIDKVVMQKRDPIFIVVHRWLRSLEQSISPYRSPMALALVTDLVQRCKAMILEPLTPIVRSHARSMFNRWHDYNNWLSLYKVKKDYQSA